MALSRLAIEHGRVWTPEGFLEDATVVVEGERIADVVPGSARSSGGERLDASDLLVLPGLIDTHSHHREPGLTHKEDIVSATRAAAMGGVTVSVGMPNVEPPITTPERYAALMEHYASRAVVDFNVNPSPTVLGAVRDLAAQGCLGFKLFMVVDTKRSYPHMPGLGMHHHGQLLEIFEAVAQTDRPLMVHPHNQEIMDVVEQRFWAEGRRSPVDYVQAQRAYDGLVWDTANQTLLSLQAATGARLHVLHLISTRSVELVRAARAAGQAVTSEVNPYALFMGDLGLIERKGPFVVGRWAPDDVKAALWEAVRDGTIDVLGTDHAPHTREEKEPGWEDMWKAPSGAPQLQDYLSQLLTCVRRGLLSLDDAVRLTSYNPARVFGLYPRKGTIEVGSDADLAIVDPERRLTIRHADALSKCGWTPYDGDEVVGVPVHTLLRGQLVMRDRVVVGQPGYGRRATPLRD